MGGISEIENWRNRLAVFDWERDLLCVADLEAGRILAISTAWERWSGFTSAELLGQPLVTFIHPLDRGLLTNVGATAIVRVRKHSGDWQALDWFRLCGLSSDAFVVLARSPAPIQGAADDLRVDLCNAYRRHDELEAAIVGADIGTWDHDFTVGLSTCNAGFAAKLGMRLEDLSPFSLETLSTYVHPEDLPALLTARKNHRDGVHPNLDAEIRMRHIDGTWHWFRSRGRIVDRDPSGAPLRASGLLIDISAVKAMEVLLSQSERLLAKTGEAAGIGGWAIDLQTMDMVLTDQMRVLRGLPPGASPDFATAMGSYVPASQALILAAVEEARASGQGFDLDLELIRSDGSRLWVRAVGSVEMRNGQPATLYGAIQDIGPRLARQNEAMAQRHRLILATESNGIGIWELDLETRQVIWDRQMFRVFGYADPPLPEASDVWNTGVTPDDQAAAEAKVNAAVAGLGRFEAEFPIRRPDGSVRIIRSVADVVVNPLTGGKSMLGVNWDITQVHSLTADLAAQHDLRRVTLRSIADAVITADAQGLVTWLNPVAETLTGWTSAEAVGQPVGTVFVLRDETTGEAIADPVQIALAQSQVVPSDGSTLLIARSGRTYGIEATASPIRDDCGTIKGAVLVFHDETDARHKRGELTYRATHDTLTGLHNRFEFDLQLAELWRRAQAGDGVHSLLYIDLDHFKQINDGCGHAAGDEVLQQVAALMSGVIRSGDFLARLGGDEFGILLDYCPPERALRVAQGICDQLEAYRYSHHGREFRTGVSIGLVGIDPQWTFADQILQAADAACLAAKGAGRNQISFSRNRSQDRL